MVPGPDPAPSALAGAAAPAATSAPTRAKTAQMDRRRGRAAGVTDRRWVMTFLWGRGAGLRSCEKSVASAHVTQGHYGEPRGGNTPGDVGLAAQILARFPAWVYGHM